MFSINDCECVLNSPLKQHFKIRIKHGLNGFKMLPVNKSIFMVKPFINQVFVGKKSLSISF